MNVTFALPVFFVAVIVNSTSPLASVLALAGDIDMRFAPALLVVAVTVSPAARQSSPLTVTVTVSLVSLKSFRLVGSTEIASGSHGTGVAVAVGVGVAVAVGVGVAATGTRSKKVLP